MPRSRSPSPRRVRQRSRSRDRDRRKDRSRRSRSRERHNNRRRSLDRDYRHRSRSRSLDKKRNKDKQYPPPKQISAADLEGKTPEEQEMLKLMGFCGFDTTKGQKVDNNQSGEVHVILKRKYRQYMNRKGGFNRPLDFVA